MMKIFLILNAVILAIDGTNRNINLARVASGNPARHFEGLDYVSMNISFANQFQKCGGSLIAAQYVLTSSTCLYDPVEGVANVVTVTSPRNSNVLSSNLKIYLHPNYNATTHENDIAVLKMNSSFILDKSIRFGILDSNENADAYVDVMLRGCGMGSISNYPRYPTKLQCTDLIGVKSNICSSLPNTICTQWSDRDNNLCNGDFGGPIYNVAHNESQYPIVTVVGIAAYSPDYRTNAPCLGGQKITYAQVASYKNWINGIIYNNKTAAKA